MKQKRFSGICLWIILFIIVGGVQSAWTFTPNEFVEVELTGPVNEKQELYEFIFPRFRTMKQYLDLMEKARDDRDVAGIVLHISQPQIGWAKIQQLRRSILDFRQSGKKAFAIITGESVPAYLVACACDEIMLFPSSPLMLSGIRIESYYLKDLLSKVGVMVDTIPIGKYKSAAEPFTRSSMSDATREMMTSLLDDYYSQLISYLVQDRGLTTDTVVALLDQGPFTPKEAVEKGLVDRLGYEENLYQAIEKDMPRYIKVVKDYDKPKPQAPKFNIFTLLFKQPASAKPQIQKKKIAMIVACGTIVPGRREDYPFQEEIIAASDLIEQINECLEDPNIVAIILRIDSPGGSAFGSDLIWHTIMKVRKEKPVVASLSDVAASGGYYIAMAAQKIVAEQGTITGSIGVITGKVVMEQLFEKIGVNVEVISRGAGSGLFSPSKPFSESQRAAMRKISLAIYDDFVDKAAKSRNLERQTVLSGAEGRVWTGRQALEKKLVDEIGGIEKAVEQAKILAGISPGKYLEIEMFPRQLGLFEFIQEMLSGGQFASMNYGLSPILHPLLATGSVGKNLVSLALVFQREPVLTLMPFCIQVK